MRWHCRPGHGYFELGIEVTPEIGTYSLIRVYLDEPVLGQLAAVLIIVEE